MKVSKIQQRLATPAEQRPVIASDTPTGSNAPVPPDMNVTAPNNFWDEAESLFNTSMAGIQQTHGELADHLSFLVSHEALLDQIKDQAGLLRNVNLLYKDIEDHIATLNAIHARHADRKGGAVTADDNMHVIQIHGLYADATEVYNQNIMPTVGHIFEQIGAAETVLELARQDQERQAAQASEAAKTAAIDPTVITDAEIKEVKAD